MTDDDRPFGSGRRLVLVGAGVVLAVAGLAAVVTVYTHDAGPVRTAIAASTSVASSQPGNRPVAPSPTPTATATATQDAAATPVPTSKPDASGPTSGNGSASRASSGKKTSGGGSVSPPSKPASTPTPPAPAPPAPPTTWMPTQAEVDAAVEAKTGATAPGLPVDGDCGFENYGTSTGSSGPAYDAISPVRIGGTTLAFTAHPITNGLFVQYYACAE